MEDRHSRITARVRNILGETFRAIEGESGAARVAAMIEALHRIDAAIGARSALGGSEYGFAHEIEALDHPTREAREDEERRAQRELASAERAT